MVLNVFEKHTFQASPPSLQVADKDCKGKVTRQHCDTDLQRDLQMPPLAGNGASTATVTPKIQK